MVVIVVSYLALVASLIVQRAVASNNNESAVYNFTLSPAATQITDNADLLPEETLQLTEALGVDNYSTLFSFADNDTSAAKRSTAACKTYAGDSDWPSELLWGLFDVLLGNALLQVAPIASPCYSNWDNYDADECDFITSNFTDSNLHASHPTSIMSPFYQGVTCMPIEREPSNCTLGGASNVAQIQLSVNLARSLNLRLVVKNTGHDFAGKSAGAGALSVWTHHFKSIAEEAYAAAKEKNVTIVGGEGETVGLAGGYIQGGGHSPLSSIYGLAKDSVLEYEVVTADGRFVTASEAVNSDLFWALRGGGGSTFGIVTSVTVKAWPQMDVSLSTFSFTISDTLSTDSFWAACHAYWSHFLTFADAGAYGYFRIWNIGEMYFGMTPFFAPNMTVAEHDALLKPWLDELAHLGIVLDINATYYDNFYDAWKVGFPLEAVGGAYGRFASRLFSRANWENATLMNQTFDAVQKTTANGYYTTGFNMKMDLHPSNTPNSANSDWRGSYLHALMSFLWADDTTPKDIKALSADMTYGAMDQWRAVTPGSGSYLGEGDATEPDWQDSFRGDNHDDLLPIKNKWDPNHVFYALHSVGSERWQVVTADGLPTQNGKLCQVS
ncbi:hypothetical protein BX600DRAFT_479116 [Xylariales sp. PMI_506]|nr:hypothetical protein BX600DRAFT_479116 [Xylariales sp. PMI_506]